jgi:16S rRNA (guanine527-N7)-methyltransferase
MTQTLNELLKQGLIANNHHLSATVNQQLLDFLALLDKWNQVFNLTAIRNAEDMVVLHILDSLAIAPFLFGKRIIDVGTGAGLPGIPLALTQPDKEFFLLDSNGKKTRFLNQVKSELSLKNIQHSLSRFFLNSCNVSKDPAPCRA